MSRQPARRRRTAEAQPALVCHEEATLFAGGKRTRSPRGQCRANKKG